ncbi:MAG: hypothetical protein N6V49_00555 [Serratia symbiotica]|nr:hypothetical protein [Serratia symbiotica]
MGRSRLITYPCKRTLLQPVCTQTARNYRSAWGFCPGPKWQIK